MEFSKQDYWSGLPFPSPDDLPDPGTEPWSPTLQPDSLLFEPQGTPRIYMYFIYIYVTIVKYHVCFAENIYIDYINTCVISISFLSE